MSRRMRPTRHALLVAHVALTTLALGACADAPTVPRVSGPPSESTAKFWEAGSSVSWNRVARELLAGMQSAATPVVQARVLTYLSIAQHNAVVAAESGRERNAHPSPAAAAAAASAVVLRSLLPASQAVVDARLAAQLAAERWPGEQHTDVGRGLAIGQSIGAAVAAYAATDGANQTPAPADPGGPGTWTGTNPFLGLFGARLLVLESANQFLPLPPPAFGSAEYTAALAELKSVLQGRTPAQVETARYWAPRINAAMNELASELIVTHRRSERDAARILALANLAGFDVLNACFAAKFAYYYIRPSQADPSITFLPGLPLPNHPSYPSGHSCLTAAYATVLAGAFPSERSRLEAMVEEAGLSRMYAGFHYRFDLDAGQELGRRVAQYVMAHGAGPRTAIPLD